MVVSYRQSSGLVFVVFTEEIKYSERELRRELENKILGLNDNQFEHIITHFKKDPNISLKNSSYTFKFVGGIVLNLNLRDNFPDLSLAIFVYPKWHISTNNQEFEIIEHLMTGFGKYFSELTSSTKSNAELMSNLDHRGAFVRNGNPPHIFTTWLSLISDTNNYGYIIEKHRIENTCLGKPNWNATFSRTTPVMINSTPHYLNPIREINGNMETIITKIHEETYSYVMTQLSKFFPMKKLLKFRKVDSLMNVNQKRSILRDAINKCSSFFMKQRLERLLSVIEESAEFNPNWDIRFGISSKGMNYFWEAMLLRTVGSKSMLNEIHECIPPLLITAGGSTQRSNNRWSKHKMDGVLSLDSNPLNQDIILYDAKHYREWDKLSIDDVTKQYAYERAMTLTPLITYTVQKNCFIFPMINIENSISSIITNKGTYSLPYLADTDIPELQIIELNPYLVLESYVKGVEHNLDDELRGALD